MKILFYSAVFVSTLFGNTSHAQDFLDQSSKWIEEGAYQSVITLLKNNEQKLPQLDRDATMIYYENLAYAYVGVGNFASAEETSLIALNVCETLFDANSWDHGKVLGRTAWIYFVQGNYGEALGYYAASLRPFETNNDASSLKTAIENMAKMYLLLAQYDHAETLLTGLKDTYNQNPALKNTPDYIMYLHSITELYRNTGRESLLAPLYAEIRDLLYIRPVHGAANCRHAILGSLANYYFETKQENLARISFEELYQIYKKQEIQDPDNLRYRTISDHFSMARYFYHTKNYDRATEHVLKINQYYAALMQHNAIHMNEVEREHFWNSLESVYNFFYSIAGELKSPELTALCYDNYLRFKSILLNTNRQIRQTIYTSENEMLINQYEELINLNFQLTMLEKGQDMSLMYFAGIDAIKEKIKKIDQYLLQEIPQYASMKQAQTVSWKDIQNKLKTTEAAIEFLSFEQSDGWKNSGEIYCSALLIKKDSDAPELISIFRQSRLEDIMQDYENPDEYRINDLYADNRLYDLVWHPISNRLENNISKIYFSVSGKLNKIAFHALTHDRKYLSQRFDLQQLSSTSVLVTGNPNDFVNRGNAFVYGNINYNSPAGMPQIGNWSNFISGSQEMQNVISGYQALGIQVNAFTGDDVTLKTFQNMVKQAPVNLFISTHGFYDRSNTDLSTSLQRTGLILSGANAFPQNDLAHPSIISAGQIAGMNLSNLDLVILSACQTGLGDVHTNEGVFGLQRAFKLAGANTMIMTLWDIPAMDAMTFMRHFLHQLKNKSKHDAFKEAQRLVRNDLVSDWAGFIMLD